MLDEVGWVEALQNPTYIITNYQLPITNYPLPITNYQLPITHYQLPITNYQLPITNYPLPITGHTSPLRERLDFGFKLCVLIPQATMEILTPANH